jgi:hypothetical protein
VPQQNNNKRKMGDDEDWAYKVVFGLPCECQQFVERACQLGHPASQDHAVLKDLQLAIKKHVEWSEQTLVECRMHWCRRGT